MNPCKCSFGFPNFYRLKEHFNLTGQPPLFEIAQDEMELGAGVHGEAGIAKFKMGTAKEVVAMILDKVSSKKTY